MTIQTGAKHTPLPWRVFDGGGTIGNRGVLAIMSKDAKPKQVIGWTGFDSSDYPKQARANAELIVAAVNEHATLLAERDAALVAVEEAKKALEATRDRLMDAIDFIATAFGPLDHMNDKKRWTSEEALNIWTAHTASITKLNDIISSLPTAQVKG